MEKISPDLKHGRQAFMYAAARILEKASFYALRGILLLYMINGPIGLSEENAQTIYGAFAGSFILSQIMGALLGDLLIGNKKAMITGGLLQAFGAFTLCIPSTGALYGSLVAIALGTGLFSPNIVSNYGKLFLNKFKLFGSAFTMLYLAVILGALIGSALASFIDASNYTLGFIVAGILMLGSVTLLFFTKKEEITIVETSSIPLKRRIFNIVIAIVCLGLFWEIYWYGTNTFSFLLAKYSLPNPGLSNIVQPCGTIFFSIIACFVWSFFYAPLLKRLATGLLLAAAGCGTLLFVSTQFFEIDRIPYILSFFLFGISEILVAPVFYSILTKNANPKYLAIVIALAGLPTMILNNYISPSWNIYSERLGLHFATVVLGGIGVIIFAYTLLKEKKKPSIEQHAS
jgi:POT family proton-dependent oligopeptide transporter